MSVFVNENRGNTSRRGSGGDELSEPSCDESEDIGKTVIVRRSQRGINFVVPGKERGKH